MKVRDPGRIRVGVIGAGVVGLSTALRVLQEFPNSVQLQVLADKFETDTTSDGEQNKQVRSDNDAYEVDIWDILRHFGTIWKT